MRRLLAQIETQLQPLDQQLALCDREIAQSARDDEAARRLQAVAGVFHMVGRAGLNCLLTAAYSGFICRKEYFGITLRIAVRDDMTIIVSRG